MIGGAIPDNKGMAGIIAKPKPKLVEKSQGILAVTGAVMPEEALAVGEIIGTVPVEPLVQR